MKLELLQGDITQLAVDAIVNAANTSLLGGGGVDGAIHQAGGKEILEECKLIREKQGGCKTGEAVITTAGQLKAKKVIHTVGPVWKGGTADEDNKLRNCYLNSIKLAEEQQFRSIAFPNISTGIYGFPKERAAKIAIDAISSAEYSALEKVFFVCFDEENYRIYQDELPYHNRMLTVSQLYIFPIKSLAGIAVSSATVTDRGFQHDRRWMLVDADNRFLTLREFPKMALLKPSIEADGLRIQSLKYPADDLMIPWEATEAGSEMVTIWNATCEAKLVGKPVDDWFSEVLGMPCQLVYMPDTSRRPVDTSSGYAPAGKFTSFADAYPFMMMSEASMDDLNSRLPNPVSILRFRPNLVFAGGTPYQEDELEDFRINDVRFTGLENCARCNVPTIDPDTGTMAQDKEPLRTLTKYRLQNKKINLGRNVVHSGTGTVRVGDVLTLG